MRLFKIKITEEEAALHFVRAQIEQAKETWPIIYQNIKNHHGKNFKIEDDSIRSARRILLFCHFHFFFLFF